MIKLHLYIHEKCAKFSGIQNKISHFENGNVDFRLFMNGILP